jgi:cyclohexa-1,5-dienecarbonyl-CoA hydratase
MAEVNVVRTPGRLRLILDAPHGNAVTDAMVGAMRDALATVGASRAVKLVTIEAAGTDFSFGSSLDEHTPSKIAAVLPRFHALIFDLLRTPAVTAAIVQGRCLGGGFEIALACDVIFAGDDSVMGLPEIGVGAFPPVGSILLPLKAGASRAASAILSGMPRPVGAWQAAGIIEGVAPRADLAKVVDRWYGSTIEQHSAAAIQRAAIASRLVVSRSAEMLLPVAERVYLDDLMTTADAAEGVAAFLAKRPPRWTDS